MKQPKPDKTTYRSLNSFCSGVREIGKKYFITQLHVWLEVQKVDGYGHPLEAKVIQGGKDVN